MPRAGDSKRAMAPADEAGDGRESPLSDKGMWRQMMSPATFTRHSIDNVLPSAQAPKDGDEAQDEENDAKSDTYEGRRASSFLTSSSSSASRFRSFQPSSRADEDDEAACASRVQLVSMHRQRPSPSHPALRGSMNQQTSARTSRPASACSTRSWNTGITAAPATPDATMLEHGSATPGNMVRSQDGIPILANDTQLETAELRSQYESSTQSRSNSGTSMGYCYTAADSPVSLLDASNSQAGDTTVVRISTTSHAIEAVPHDESDNVHVAVVTEVASAHGLHYQIPPEQFANLDRRMKDHLERLKAQHLYIPETQKYTFAIVLKHSDQVYQLLRRRMPSRSEASIRRDLHERVSKMQQKCLRRLVQAGLGVLVLDNSVYNSDPGDEDEQLASRNICVLINPKKEKGLLLHEYKRELDELAIRQGDALERMSSATNDCGKDMYFSPALELQLTHNIIQNALKDYDLDEWQIEQGSIFTVQDIVHKCFPLHDRRFNSKFFGEYRKKTFEFNLKKAMTGNRDRWAVEELRLHFGERVAFLFAFMHIYTKHLLPITFLCVGYYLCFRFLQGDVWAEYMKGLSVIGFGVACFWGPSFLICWERETRLLNDKWNLQRYKNTVFEQNDQNPDFEYVWNKNAATGEMEKVPKARWNYWIRLTMLFYVIVSAAVQCLCLLPFIQWYVYAKNAPTCTKCHKDNENDSIYKCIWFISCFTSESSKLGTDRWVYILIQGIALGLMIDIIFFEMFNWISLKFVKWENYAKLSDHENRLIHRRFVFVWSNWFFWFLFLAFVYLPFGEYFLKFLKDNYLGKLAPYEWDPSVLTLDTLFVTPLVVTQFLNMLLETIVPYFVRKLRGRPMSCRKTSSVNWCARKLFGRFRRARNKEECDRRVKTMSARRLAKMVETTTGQHIEVKYISDDSNTYSAYQVIAESKLPVFDPVLDYLDACIQFSYVIMFTVVWPLLPFPAFFNNVLEVRGDAFRLLFAHRRPMPRRDSSIGEWATVLAYANIIGITVVMAFIVVYHFGYFLTSCDFTFNDGYMVPFNAIDRTGNSNCKDLGDYPDWIMIQVFVFVLLEHVGFCFRYLVLQIEKDPWILRNSGYQRLKQIAQLTSADSASPEQFEYVQKLRELFVKYDRCKDGHLRERDLIPFLAEWLCKPQSELMLYSSTIFRYMDKPRLGRIPFTTCCLMLQNANHDRFFSCLLGLYDPEFGDLNEEIHSARDGMELRRVLSEVASVSERRSSLAGRESMDSAQAHGLRHSNNFFFNDGMRQRKESIPYQE